MKLNRELTIAVVGRDAPYPRRRFGRFRVYSLVFDRPYNYRVIINHVDETMHRLCKVNKLLGG